MGYLATSCCVGWSDFAFLVSNSSDVCIVAAYTEGCAFLRLLDALRVRLRDLMGGCWVVLTVAISPDVILAIISRKLLFASSVFVALVSAALISASISSWSLSDSPSVRTFCLPLLRNTVIGGLSSYPSYVSSSSTFMMCFFLRLWGTTGGASSFCVADSSSVLCSSSISSYSFSFFSFFSSAGGGSFSDFNSSSLSDVASATGASLINVWKLNGYNKESWKSLFFFFM